MSIEAVPLPKYQQNSRCANFLAWEQLEVGFLHPRAHAHAFIIAMKSSGPTAGPTYCADYALVLQFQVEEKECSVG